MQRNNPERIGAGVNFAGKTAVVTGGASGIGRGIVEALLEVGAKVVIADIEQAALDRAVRELRGMGEVVGCATDITNGESVEKLADYVYSTFGRCNLLVSNAGVSSGQGNIWEAHEDDFHWVFEVNVLGLLNVVRKFVPRMIAEGSGGWIVGTSSGDGGIAPSPRNAVYSASKAAMTTLLESLANQLAEAKADIGVSVLYPSGGLLRTNMWSSVRNRPERFANAEAKAGFADFDEFLSWLESSGRSVPQLDPTEFGRFMLAEVHKGEFIIAHERSAIAELLHERADAFAQAELPPNIGYGLSALRQGLSSRD